LKTVPWEKERCLFSTLIRLKAAKIVVHQSLCIEACYQFETLHRGIYFLRLFSTVNDKLITSRVVRCVNVIEFNGK
jgi:hypothetical protein